jgi:KDO2-lipid IV(A) lauroyltransferase
MSHLQDAVKSGRGAILVTAHLGFPHLIPSILSAKGYRIQEVIAAGARSKREKTRAMKLTSSSRFRRYIYERTKVLTDDISELHIIADLDIRPIYRLLGENGIVMIAGDGFKSAKFVLLPLLGEMYPFPIGYMNIAMMTKTPVLPAFCIPDLKGEIAIKIHMPLAVDLSATPEDNVQLFASVLDAQIRETPHLWLRWGKDNWFERARKWAARDLKERYTKNVE